MTTALARPNESNPHTSMAWTVASAVNGAKMKRESMIEMTAFVDTPLRTCSVAPLAAFMELLTRLPASTNTAAGK